MVIRIRRTLGQGPPSGLEFGQIAFSNEDQLLHVGRPAPDHPASFEARFAQLTRSVQFENDFVPIEGWANELIVISPKLAMVQFGVTRATTPANITTVLTWEGYPASPGVRTGAARSSASADGFCYVTGSSVSMVPAGQGVLSYLIGSILFPLQ